MRCIKSAIPPVMLGALFLLLPVFVLLRPKEVVEVRVVSFEPLIKSMMLESTLPAIVIAAPTSAGSAIEIPSPEEPVEASIHGYSDEEIELIARVAYAEAGDQSDYGIRLVVDVILNRVDSDRFPSQNDIRSVIYAKNQFSVVSSGSMWKHDEWVDIRDLVVEELGERTNSDVIAFRTGHYHKWATPAFKEGDHYFSTF